MGMPVPTGRELDRPEALLNLKFRKAAPINHHLETVIRAGTSFLFRNLFKLPTAIKWPKR